MARAYINQDNATLLPHSKCCQKLYCMIIIANFLFDIWHAPTPDCVQKPISKVGRIRIIINNIYSIQMQFHLSESKIDFSVFTFGHANNICICLFILPSNNSGMFTIDFHARPAWDFNYGITIKSTIKSNFFC